jgi:septal ring factor EnvC (AmiA/AmiB activator)
LDAAETREKELQAKVRQLERDLAKVTEKLEGIKKDNKVKLTQAKEVAQKKANELIAQKLKACSDAYKQEFQTLAVQFARLKDESDRQKSRENEYRKVIMAQEDVLYE